MCSDIAPRQILILRAAYSSVGIVIGISVFFVWLFFMEPTTDATIHITLSGGLSGVLAAWNTITHIMHLKDYWRTWLKGLKCFMAVGIFFMIVTAAGFITYLVLGIIRNEEMLVASFYIASVWSIVSFKWAALLLWYSRSYRNEYSDLSALLDF